MSTLVLNPRSREEWLQARGKTVGGSEIAALFGVHPFQTAYELHHLKAGTLKADPSETGPMRRGRHLEAVAVEFLREERPGWTVTANPIPGGKFYCDADAGLSCTPDAFVVDPEREGFGVCQIKSVEPSIYRNRWKGEDGIEPPLYVAIQAIQEAMLTGASWAVVCPLVIGFEIEMPVLDVPLHVGLIDRLRGEAAAFWRGVKADQAPDPDFGRDGAAIARLYADDDGTTIDLSADNRVIELLAQREALKLRESDGTAAEKDRKTIDVEILSKLKDATRATLADGRTIEAKTIRRAAYQAKASSYRQIKIRTAA